MKNDHPKTKCRISTPQFSGLLLHHYHEQNGSLDEFTLLFTPDNFDCGNHIVQFNSMEEFHKAVKEIYN